MVADVPRMLTELGIDARERSQESRNGERQASSSGLYLQRRLDVGDAGDLARERDGLVLFGRLT